jgi:hypothetical protein
MLCLRPVLPGIREEEDGPPPSSPAPSPATQNSSKKSENDAYFYGLLHGRRNFKDTNPLMSSSLVILFGEVKQFGKF